MTQPRTDLYYNGVTLRNVLTRSFNERPVYDESGTDVVNHIASISVSSFVHDISAVTAFGVIPQFGVDTPTIFANVKSALMSPRGQFVYSVGGTPILAIAADGDVDNGPKPRDVRLTHIASNKLFRIEFDIDVAFVDCNDSTNTKGILSNRWSMTDAVDANWFTVRVMRGTLRVASINLNPQSFRGMVIPPLQKGFKRESIECVTSRDGLSLDYAVVDREVYNSAPKPSTTWSCKHTESVNDALTSISDIDLTLEGPPKVAKQDLIALGAQVIQAIINVPQFNTSTMMVGASIVDHVEDNAISMKFTFRRSSSTAEFYTIIDQSMGKAPQLKNYDPLVSQNPQSSDLADPTGLFISFLQSPCNDQHSITQVTDGPTDTGQTSSARDAKITRSSTSQLPSTGSPGYTSDQLKAIYTHYKVKSHYDIYQNNIALPIAGGSSFATSAGATRAIVTMAPPMAFRRVEITAQRFGDWPKLPTISPTINDPTGTAVLVDVAELEPKAPEMTLDGKNRLYEVRQVLTYSLPKVPQSNQFLASGLPWQNPTTDDLLIPPRAFGANILTP